MDCSIVKELANIGMGMLILALAFSVGLPAYLYVKYCRGPICSTESSK